MKNTIVPTLDGSSTLLSGQFGVHYHSIRGAIGEAKHLFIRFLEPGDAVLEIGFGTGLNALLALQTGLKVDYTTIELFPVDMLTVLDLSFFCSELRAIHDAPWGVRTQITPTFSILKINADVLSYTPTGKFDKIFFDAFDPLTVPDQWSVDMFIKMRSCLSPFGKLLTYCSKGVVKQALRNAGFTVTRAQGALGKHHMLVCE